MTHNLTEPPNNNHELLKTMLLALATIAILILVASFAKAEDAPTLKPSPAQADHLKVLQLEAREKFRDLIDAQRAYAPKIQAMQDYCREVIKENKWPDDTTCSGISATDPSQLLGADITFYKKPPATPESKPNPPTLPAKQ